MYFGFIALISSAPALLSQPSAAGTITVGLTLAYTIIVTVVVLTGIYVHRSNGHFEQLLRAAREELGQ